jgi:hypothetical protein
MHAFKKKKTVNREEKSFKLEIKSKIGEKLGLCCGCITSLFLKER